MEPENHQQANDDIAHLKAHLGEDTLHYHDISREAELQEIVRRWPLLAESEATHALNQQAPRA